MYADAYTCITSRFEFCTQGCCMQLSRKLLCRSHRTTPNVTFFRIRKKPQLPKPCVFQACQQSCMVSPESPLTLVHYTWACRSSRCGKGKGSPYDMLVLQEFLGSTSSSPILAPSILHPKRASAKAGCAYQIHNKKAKTCACKYIYIYI